jgi:putative ABC transport system permease protein
MRSIAFAWRSLVRQPARAVLGILGVAAVGALLFDMLLLSEGLVASMRDLLDRTGSDIRVMTTSEPSPSAPRIAGAAAVSAAVAALPSVRTSVAVRLVSARIEGAGETRPPLAWIHGVTDGPGRPWVVLRGRDAERAGEAVVNEAVVTRLGIGPGGTLTLRASCLDGPDAPPPLQVAVTGVAEFPFEPAGQRTLAATMATLDAACGGNTADEANLLVVTSDGDADAAAAAIRALRPDLQVVTNDELVGRFQQNGFTYFRQISTVLTTVTVAFALLLITVLLTVSVNQRLGEIAALRALGFSQRRVVSDVLSESALIVGTGGLLSLPLGAGLAVWLDGILKGIPGIPAAVHFFVFDPGALWLHLALLALTTVAAAVYPMQIVARLPVAATLRREVTS